MKRRRLWSSTRLILAAMIVLALGIAPGSFSRLCRAYGIETPHARWCRRRQEGRRTRVVHAIHLAAGGQLAAAEATGEAARLGLDLEDVLATAGALDEAY